MNAGVTLPQDLSATRDEYSCPTRAEYVLIEAITIGPRHRSVDESKVVVIAESMRQLGLQQPITVWTGDGITIHLVAGLHRLRAAERLEWDMIPCFLVKMDERERKLWEIDENLCRAELSPVQVAEHTAARKAVWEAKRAAMTVEQPALALGPDDGEAVEPAAEKVSTGVAEQVSGELRPKPKGGRPNGFAADTAAKTGMSKRTINQALHRAENIAPDVLHDVVGTKLDTGTSLDRLAKLTHEEQRKVVEAGGFPPPAPAATAQEPPASEAELRQGPTAQTAVPMFTLATSLRERFDHLASRLPDQDDGQYDKIYVADLVAEITGPAAKLCDVFLDAGDRAGAASVAHEFGLPISLMPINFGNVREAVAAAKLSKKELRSLGYSRSGDYGGHPDSELSVEDLYRHRKLLVRIGVWPKITPEAPTADCDGPVAVVYQVIDQFEVGAGVLGRDAVARAVGGGVNSADSVAAAVERLREVLMD